MLIDTHAHLNFKAFKKNLDNVLWGAREEGVEEIIVPGTDLETSRKAVELARHYEIIFAAVGIHPHHCNAQYQLSNVKTDLTKLAKNNKVVAIGECGLDYYHYEKTKYKDYKVDKEFKKKQKELFQIQLEVAQELKLPVIIHSREAHQDLQKILKAKKYKNLNGVFHCFTADKKFLKWALKKGFYIGFDGNITYDQKLLAIVKATPLSRILIETDAPLLLPEPLRSLKKFPNKPENIKIIAEYIARAKNKSFSQVAKKTTANARKLFHFYNVRLHPQQ